MNELLEKVEETRRLMVINGLKYGLMDSKTIELSKKLDELLNAYSEIYENTSLKH